MSHGRSRRWGQYPGMFLEIENGVVNWGLSFSHLDWNEERGTCTFDELLDGALAPEIRQHLGAQAYDEILAAVRRLRGKKRK
jgi:hypothetical protein